MQIKADTFGDINKYPILGHITDIINDLDKVAQHKVCSLVERMANLKHLQLENAYLRELVRKDYLNKIDHVCRTVGREDLRNPLRNWFKVRLGKVS